MSSLQNKTFTKEEMKLLVYNKINKKGMSYEQAYQEVKEELQLCKKNHEKKPMKDNKNFKKEFMRLKNEKN
jgi:hypothetical protein